MQNHLWIAPYKVVKMASLLGSLHKCNHHKWGGWTTKLENTYGWTLLSQISKMGMEKMTGLITWSYFAS